MPIELGKVNLHLVFVRFLPTVVLAHGLPYKCSSVPNASIGIPYEIGAIALEAPKSCSSSTDASMSSTSSIHIQTKHAFSEILIIAFVWVHSKVDLAFLVSTVLTLASLVGILEIWF